MKECEGGIRFAAPRPTRPRDDDVMCCFHGEWRGTWEEHGLDDDWNQCQACANWYCPKCGVVNENGSGGHSTGPYGPESKARNVYDGLFVIAKA